MKDKARQEPPRWNLVCARRWARLSCTVILTLAIRDTHHFIDEKSNIEGQLRLMCGMGPARSREQKYRATTLRVGHLLCARHGAVTRMTVSVSYIPEGTGCSWCSKPWDVRAGCHASSRSSSPLLNQWATESQTEEATSPKPHGRCSRPTWHHRFSKMFVLLLGFPVLKLILIPLLKQLSFNTPKTDHYPPKVEKARSLFVTQAISYLLVFPHFLLLQRAEMGKLQRTQQSGVLATAAATAVKQAMGVLGSQEPDMFPEGREGELGCLWRGSGRHGAFSLGVRAWF